MIMLSAKLHGMNADKQYPEGRKNRDSLERQANFNP